MKFEQDSSVGVSLDDEETEFSSNSKTPKGISLDGFNLLRNSFDDLNDAEASKKQTADELELSRVRAILSSSIHGDEESQESAAEATPEPSSSSSEGGSCSNCLDIWGELFQFNFNSSTSSTKAPTTPIMKKVYLAKNDEEILYHIRNQNFVNIDPLLYNITNESKQNIHFNIKVWCEDIMINTFTPLSYLYVYFKYGKNELRNRHMLTGFNKKEHPIEHDGEQSLVQMKAATFFVYNMVFINLKAFLVFCYWMGGYSYKPSTDGRTSAPAYYLLLATCFYFMHQMMYANKKALRRKGSQIRLMIEREKRNEELLSGWLPLPWWVVIFELRIAAVKANVDTNEKIYFRNVSVAELRAALGEKVLSYVERSRDEGRSPSIDRSMTPSSSKQLSHPFLPKHVFEEKRINGSSCTVIALMMRGILENSFANPAFGEDGAMEYAQAHFSKLWFAFCWVLMASPLLVDIWMHKGTSQFDSWGIACCVIAFAMLPISTIAAPPAFIWAAIVSLERKTRLQCFLNNLLDPNVDVNHHNKWRSSWPYALDLAEPKNIMNWRKLRSCALKFGKIYSTRTDINAGMMVGALGCVTASFILFTAINGSKIYVYDIAYYVLIHMFFVVIVGLFCMKLAVAGEICNEFVLRCKAVLASAVLTFESSFGNNKDIDVAAVRGSFLQLQEYLNSDEKLHEHKVLTMIPLNKALVGTIAFICFTQVTLLLDNVTLTPPG